MVVTSTKGSIYTVDMLTGHCLCISSIPGDVFGSPVMVSGYTAVPAILYLMLLQIYNVFIHIHSLEMILFILQVDNRLITGCRDDKVYCFMVKNAV